MTQLRRNPVRGRQQLPLHLVDWLLGVYRPIAEIDELHAAGVEYDSFYTFDADHMAHDEVESLWRTHGEFLRREAERRGLQLPAARR
jgi:hypothetical protein